MQSLINFSIEMQQYRRHNLKQKFQSNNHLKQFAFLCGSCFRYKTHRVSWDTWKSFVSIQITSASYSSYVKTAARVTSMIKGSVPSFSLYNFSTANMIAECNFLNCKYIFGAEEDF